MLDSPGALEDEIAQLISDRATDRARDLFAAGDAPPVADDLFSRAVCGVYAQLVTARDRAADAERMRQFQETDALLARIRAGEDVEL